MIEFLANYYGWGTQALSIVVGVVFLVHGWPKLSRGAGAGIWGGSRLAARAHGLVEVLAAFSVGFGFWTEWGAMAMVVVMLGALYHKIFRWKTGFSSSNGTGWEFDLVVLAGALAILLG
jgi:putative oxidoreductase